jgi:hypothetical protein
MGLYRYHIFPRLMNWVMAGEEFRHLRMELLAQVHGEVLELGIGTGLNLPHYPKTITGLHAVDPANPLPKIVTERTTSQSFPVRIQHVTAESCPMPPNPLISPSVHGLSAQFSIRSRRFERFVESSSLTECFYF